MSVLVKKVSHVQKDYILNRSTCICENSRYFKSTADNSIVCNKFVSVTDNVLTNIDTSIVSIYSDDKKGIYKMDCYILHTFLLVAILPFIIGIICCHYKKFRSK